MRRRFCYTGGLFPPVSRAGEWFLRSGIQTPDGGVARYYRSDLGRNHAVSTEITGYAASALVFLDSLVGHALACPPAGASRARLDKLKHVLQSDVTGQHCYRGSPDCTVRDYGAAERPAMGASGGQGEVSGQPCDPGGPDYTICDYGAAERPAMGASGGQGEVTGQEPEGLRRVGESAIEDSARTWVGSARFDGLKPAPPADPRYLDRARAAARFLTGAWDAASAAMPFEIDPARFTYFFDCGIVVRGLLAVWRATGDEQFLQCARLVGDSMAHDFRAPDGEFHPILTLPAKRPLERDPLRWSRSPGCYQLKAAMAWWDLWEATGDGRYRELYEGLREEGLRTAGDFLPGQADRRKVVDRLHAFLYFLEGLLPMPCDALGEGIARVAGLVRELAPEFERSDVYAQLLRVRLYADGAGAVELDRAAAQWEAGRLMEFAAEEEDARVDGGFYFGRTAGKWEPYINPVSTAFALQALALWSGGAPAGRHLLI